MSGFHDMLLCLLGFFGGQAAVGDPRYAQGGRG
jgi:hypothetical protein